jgi:hypothetical protein
MNACHSAEDVRIWRRRIILRHGIPSRNPPVAFLAYASDQAMRENASIAHHQRDVSKRDAMARRVLDHQQIARPQGGEHAGAECLNPEGTAGAENTSRKFKLLLLAELCRRLHARGN